MPATLVQTTSVERLAEFYYRASRGKDSTRLVYPAAYFEWAERLPGSNRYLDSVLIDVEHRVIGLAIARPLTLGMWANMKLRSAIRETSSDARLDRSPKGWVRYLTRARDRELAIALASVLPEESYALRAAVVEFLEVDPSVAALSLGMGVATDVASQLEATLLDVLIGEARASGYDYVLAWVEAGRRPRQLTRAASATAVYDELPPDDGGILGVVNFYRRLYRTIAGWVTAARAALARIPSRIRGRLADARASHWRRAFLLRAEHRGEVDWAAISRAQREQQTADPVTLDGFRLRRIGSPSTQLDDRLLEELRDLIANASERFAIFPTYSAAALLAVLKPSDADARFSHRYAAIREASGEAKLTNLSHDVLAFAAEKDGRYLALIFGHRLPRLSRDGQPSEVFAVRATLFAPDLGPLVRADLLRSAADEAERIFGISRTIYLRPTGLGEVAFSRFILGARRASAPLTLNYVPLSERARAEEAILERRLPISYL